MDILFKFDVTVILLLDISFRGWIYRSEIPDKPELLSSAPPLPPHQIFQTIIGGISGRSMF
jgi:hypothetical protein